MRAYLYVSLAMSLLSAACGSEPRHGIVVFRESGEAHSLEFGERVQILARNAGKLLVRSDEITAWVPTHSVAMIIESDGECAEIGLKQGEEAEILSVSFEGSGNYFGDSLSLKLKVERGLGMRLCPKLDGLLVVEDAKAGSDGLDPSRPRYQRMLVTSIRNGGGGRSDVAADRLTIPERSASGISMTPTSELSLGMEAGSELIAISTAFCIDSKNAAPGLEMAMQIANFELDSDGVRLVLQASEGYNPEVLQDAIWAVLRDHPETMSRSSGPCDLPTISDPWLGLYMDLDASRSEIVETAHNAGAGDDRIDSDVLNEILSLCEVRGESSTPLEDQICGAARHQQSLGSLLSDAEIDPGVYGGARGCIE